MRSNPNLLEIFKRTLEDLLENSSGNLQNILSRSLKVLDIESSNQYVQKISKRF